ncbi:hypothetical protein RR48_06948 [Papilio machaon]|uniref:Retrotransposon gag domain-containing protein n=1 Tax=Papilio machaon TaxID=76193 RepID=A0A194R8N5_PAPMA|nr:hypothetical protein RR48_06948 [Papilio machaon]
MFWFLLVVLVKLILEQIRRIRSDQEDQKVPGSKKIRGYQDINLGQVKVPINKMCYMREELSEIRIERTYTTFSDMITDFRKKMLVKKSFTSIQKHIESISQGHTSINEYGAKLEKLLTDLNISQADGNECASTILKPIKEKSLQTPL